VFQFKVFHSLDDERRIESAFTPISSNPLPIKNVSTGNITVAATNSSRNRVLSSSHDDNLTSTLNDHLAKSNESLLDQQHISKPTQHRSRENIGKRDRFSLTPNRSCRRQTPPPLHPLLRRLRRPLSNPAPNGNSSTWPSSNRPPSPTA
jgi:hypothetical protein